MPLKPTPLLLLALACVHRPQLAAMDGIAMAGDRAPQPAEADEPGVSANAYRHYLDAMLAQNADDLATAGEELRQALIHDPRSPHLHTVLAEVLLKQGQIGAAEVHLGTALELDPRHAPARVLRARIAASRGQVLQATHDLQDAIRAQPDEPQAYRDLSRILLAMGDVAGAEEVAVRLSDRLAAALKRSPAGPDELVTADRLRDACTTAWVELGRWAAQHGMDELAQRSFQTARAASPSDSDALAAEASWLESKRRFAEARERYLRLLAQRPEAPDVLAALARVALSEGDLEAVSAHAAKLLALAKNFAPWDGKSPEGEDDRRDVASALFRIGVPLVGAHRSADAQTVVEGALRLYPDHPELSFYRALALVQRGRPREGAAAFESIERRLNRRGKPVLPAFLGLDAEVLALDARVQAALARARAGESHEAMRRLRVVFAQRPSDESVALALLEAYDRAGRAADAERLLAEAAREHSDSDGLLFALANAQDRAGSRDEALATMRRVLAADPMHAGALNYIGYTLLERGREGDLAEAELLLSRAVELRPDDGAVADSYGYCLLKLGRTGDALPELRRADRLSPEDPVILGHLGDALLASGHRDEAVATFRHALSASSPPPAPRAARAARSTVDPPDRLDREGAKVRAEIEKKLRSLAP